MFPYKLSDYSSVVISSPKPLKYMVYGGTERGNRMDEEFTKSTDKLLDDIQRRYLNLPDNENGSLINGNITGQVNVDQSGLSKDAVADVISRIIFNAKEMDVNIDETTAKKLLNIVMSDFVNVKGIITKSDVIKSLNKVAVMEELKELPKESVKAVVVATATAVPAPAPVVSTIASTPIPAPPPPVKPPLKPSKPDDVDDEVIYQEEEDKPIAIMQNLEKRMINIRKVVRISGKRNPVTLYLELSIALKDRLETTKIISMYLGESDARNQMKITKDGDLLHVNTGTKIVTPTDGQLLFLLDNSITNVEENVKKNLITQEDINELFKFFSAIGVLLVGDNGKVKFIRNAQSFSKRLSDSAIDKYTAPTLSKTQRKKKENKTLVDSIKSLNALKAKFSDPNAKYNDQLLIEKEIIKLWTQINPEDEYQKAGKERLNEIDNELSKVGSGMKKRLVRRPATKKAPVKKTKPVLMTLSEAKNRIKVLVGQIQAGNKSKAVKNELSQVCDYLLQHKAITKLQHKRIHENFILN